MANEGGSLGNLVKPHPHFQQSKCDFGRFLRVRLLLGEGEQWILLSGLFDCLSRDNALVIRF